MNREGFWSSKEEPDLPRPRSEPGTKAWLGRKQFLSSLAVVETQAKEESYRGFSTCRLCGEVNGIAEYTFKNWCWPSGYRHYVEAHNVRPSLAFQEHILRFASIKIVMPRSIKVKSGEGYSERRDRLARQGKEPSMDSVNKFMVESGQGFYAAREELRSRAYGGPVPSGHASWGDYWKNQ